jgi:hypothetical protein
MLYREVIAACSMIQKNNKKMHPRQNINFLSVKPAGTWRPTGP